MKLSDDKKKQVDELRSQAAHASGIKAGDRITIGVTHQIEIQGDESWVKFEASSVVGDEETDRQAFDRVNEYVNDSVMRVVETAVNTVNGLYEKGNKP